MHQDICLRLIEWGVSAENIPLKKVIRKAMDIEASNEAYQRELRYSKSNPPGPDRKWGRFANRASGLQKWKPSEDDDEPKSKGKKDKVRANAVTPQPSNGEPSQLRSQGKGKREGRQISRAKRDELRVAGKCFQCEETGHDQRNCPKLRSAKRPTVSAATIDAARRERVASSSNSPSIRVNAILFDVEGEVDNVSETELRAYSSCANEWGTDIQWLDPWTLADGRHSIDRYGTDAGDLVEIRDNRQPEMGVLEIAASRFWDPNFSLADIHLPEANTDLSCIREGRYRNLRDYKVWEWSVLNWLQRTVAKQIQFESSTDSVNIWLALDGYCFHLDGTDAFYGPRHAEVLGDTFNPRRVLNQM